MELLEYVDEQGRRPFRAWFDRLDVTAARRITESLLRLQLGNTSNVKSVGGGIYEARLMFGPGYRLYFGYVGAEIVLLVCGGTKRRQDDDIETAKARWSDFKRRGGYAAWH